MMRISKLLIVGLLLAIPGLATADASDIPGASTWYFHVDLDEMRSDEVGKSLYGWMDEEIFSEIAEDTGVKLGEELDRVTAYSLEEQGPVFLFEGNISQKSKDLVMTFIAAEGDLQPMKSSGKSYYRVAAESGEDGEESNRNVGGGNIEFQIEALAEESWISLDLKNKVILTSSEEQMKAMLADGGKIKGGRSHKGALLVLTAEKALLQAGMNSSALGADDDGDSDWDSNILRNTEQVAILVAAVANKLAIEIELITTEPEMAQSLASVARGLISLVSFDDSMDDDAIAVLQSTKVEAKGNSLNLSLAIDPSVVVATLRD
jgi:hypothetical protein